MITLKTLAASSEQDVLDQVATHLLTQDKKSKESGTPSASCMYRGVHNLQCAAGCLIGDDEYDKTMEHGSWADVINQGFATDTHKELILTLQSIHDEDTPRDWKTQLLSLAENYELDTDAWDDL